MKTDEILKKAEQMLEGKDQKAEILRQIKQNLEEMNKREKQKEEVETKAGLFIFLLIIFFIIITLINLALSGY
jgi:hypothetical protein